MEHGNRVSKPKVQRIGHLDALGEQWDAEKQNAGVAEEISGAKIATSTVGSSNHSDQ